MPARADDIETIARLTSELTTRRVAEEQITPLRQELVKLTTEVRVLNVRIVGNGSPGLLQRMEKLENRPRRTLLTVAAFSGALATIGSLLWHIFRT